MIDDPAVRTVKVEAPSFPAVAANRLLAQPADEEVWQVLCGDDGHWRAGIFSPAQTAASELSELELHDCPELFLLISGALTLVIADHSADALRELPLEAGRPVLVSAPHGGFCPDGPHSGRAFVVERDRFTTTYREAAAWLTTPAP